MRVAMRSPAAVALGLTATVKGNQGSGASPLAGHEKGVGGAAASRSFSDVCMEGSGADRAATPDVGTIETLDTLGLVKEHRHLVLNRADDEVGLSTGQVEGILKMKVVSTMPTSLAVANATNHGRPIVLAKPDHPVSASIQALSRRLAGVAAHAPADAVSVKRGLFGRKK